MRVRASTPPPLRAGAASRTWRIASERWADVARHNVRLIEVETGEEQVQAALGLADACNRLEQPAEARAPVGNEFVLVAEQSLSVCHVKFHPSEPDCAGAHHGQEHFRAAGFVLLADDTGTVNRARPEDRVIPDHAFG